MDPAVLREAEEAFERECELFYSDIPPSIEPAMLQHVAEELPRQLAVRLLGAEAAAHTQRPPDDSDRTQPVSRLHSSERTHTPPQP